MHGYADWDWQVDLAVGNGEYVSIRAPWQPEPASLGGSAGTPQIIYWSAASGCYVVWQLNWPVCSGDCLTPGIVGQVY